MAGGAKDARLNPHSQHLEAFQKWLQLGDDRNTASIYVQGQQVYP